MAFETLGLNITASGIAGVARQMGHLANSFIKYINVVERTDRAALKAAASQNKLAQTMMDKNVKALDVLMSKQDRLIIQYSRLDTAIQAARLTMRDPVKALNEYQLALQRVATAQKNLATAQKAMAAQTPGSPQHSAFAAIVAQNQKELEKLNLELQKVTREYANSLKEQTKYRNDMLQLSNTAKQLREVSIQIPEAQNAIAESTIRAAEATQTYDDLLNQAASNTGIMGRLLSDLTGGFGKSTMATSGMTKALGLTVPQLAAVMVAMDAIALGAKIAQAAIKIFVNVIKTIWNVAKKAAEIVWNLAKAIGTTLWGALKKIVSFPFNVISRLFGGVGGSLQRVMEMAIGMNMSRVWWQLGLRFRELAKTAADAATEYQVTFMRLRGLMLNEVLGKQGVSASDPDYIIKYNAALLEANKQTQELVTWTSKLAVATIFDAESILDVYTLAMAYDFTSKSAKELTTAVLDFATGMGLGDTEMRRVIENFGQMRAQGKIVGTELRDLARGAFVPVNEVLERMAKNAGVIGDYDVPNLQEITSVLTAMRESGELTESTFAAISSHIAKLGSDGKITRQEFETLAAELKDPAVLQRFGLTAEQAGKALEGIKTGQLTKELNDLIATGKLTIDEFFEAFIEMAEDRFPNAAMSMGLSMKALRSNLEDYIKTMFGWRLLAPVFEVVAKHVQGFVQNSLMSESQIQLFDRMGLAFKNVTELLMSYSNAVFKARNLSKQLFGMGNISQMWRFANEFVSIIGSLGTEKFAEKFDIFKFALKQIPLAGESRQLVLSGIQELNKIMSDIMAGIEVEPEAFKKAMNNVFGTLWKDYFKPELEKLWNENVIPAIKKKIGQLWENIKSAFNTWKTETLLPGLKKFLTKTLPEWFGGVSEWVKKNGPKIISEVARFAQNILDAFAEGSGETFGENHWLTILVKLLASLAEYASTKILDPTADINTTNLENVVELFERLKKAVSIEIGGLTPIQAFLEGLSKEGTSESIASLITMLSILDDVFSTGGSTAEAFTGFFEVLSSFWTLPKSGGGGLEKLMAFWALIVTAPQAGGLALIDPIIGSLERLLLFIRNLQDIDWSGVNGIIGFIDAITTAWSNAKADSKMGQALDSARQSISNFVQTILGLDVYGALDKAKAIIDFITTGFGTGEWKWLTTDPVDLEVGINPIPVVETPSPTFWDNILTSIGIKKPPKTDVEVSDIVNFLLPSADDLPKWDWLDTLLWGAGGRPGKIDVEMPEIEIEGISNSGTEAGAALATAFSTSVNTAMGEIEISIPPVPDTTNIGTEAGATLTTSFLTNVTTTMSNMELPVPPTPDTKKIGSNMGQGIINGISSKQSAAVAAARAFVNAVNAEFLKLWKIESPSKVFMGFGERLIEGLILGIKQSTVGAVSQARDAAIDIKHGFGSSVSSNSNYSYTTNSNNTNNWNVRMSTPIIASTPLQAYEVLRMRAR